MDIDVEWLRSAPPFDRLCTLCTLLAIDPHNGVPTPMIFTDINEHLQNGDRQDGDMLVVCARVVALTLGSRSSLQQRGTTSKEGKLITELLKLVLEPDFDKDKLIFHQTTLNDLAEEVIKIVGFLIQSPHHFEQRLLPPLTVVANGISSMMQWPYPTVQKLSTRLFWLLVHAELPFPVVAAGVTAALHACKTITSSPTLINDQWDILLPSFDLVLATLRQSVGSWHNAEGTRFRVSLVHDALQCVVTALTTIGIGSKRDALFAVLVEIQRADVTATRGAVAVLSKLAQLFEQVFLHTTEVAEGSELLALQSPQFTPGLLVAPQSQANQTRSNRFPVTIPETVDLRSPVVQPALHSVLTFLITDLSTTANVVQTKYLWLWEDDGIFRPFYANANDLVEEAYNSRKAKVFKLPLTGATIDFSAFVQISSAHRVRDVRRQFVPMTYVLTEEWNHVLPVSTTPPSTPCVWQNLLPHAADLARSAYAQPFCYLLCSLLSQTCGKNPNIVQPLCDSIITLGSSITTVKGSPIATRTLEREFRQRVALSLSTALFHQLHSATSVNIARAAGVGAVLEQLASTKSEAARKVPKKTTSKARGTQDDAITSVLKKLSSVGEEEEEDVPRRKKSRDGSRSTTTSHHLGEPLMGLASLFSMPDAQLREYLSHLSSQHVTTLTSLLLHRLSTDITPLPVFSDSLKTLMGGSSKSAPTQTLLRPMIISAIGGSQIVFSVCKEEKDEISLLCPNRHTLRNHRSKRWKCNRCGVHKSEHSFGCRVCDFDLCQQCSGSTANLVALSPFATVGELYIRLGVKYGEHQLYHDSVLLTPNQTVFQLLKECMSPAEYKRSLVGPWLQYSTGRLSSPMKLHCVKLLGSTCVCGHGVAPQAFCSPPRSRAELPELPSLRVLNLLLQVLPQEQIRQVQLTSAVVGKRVADVVSKNALPVALLRSDGLPPWVVELLFRHAYLIPLHIRHAIFSFINATALQKLMEMWRNTHGMARFSANRSQPVSSALKLFTSSNIHSTKLDVQFDGEPGVGEGVAQEFFTQFSIAIHDPELKLFEQEAANWLTPAPSSPGIASTATAENAFLSLGAVVGKALIDHRRIPLHLLPFMYAYVEDRENSRFTDASGGLRIVQQIDATFSRSLRVLYTIPVADLKEMCLDLRSGKEVEDLKELDIYVAEQCDVKVKSILPQLREFRHGLRWFCDSRSLAMLQGDEINTLINGRLRSADVPLFTKEELQHVIAPAHGYTHDSLHITQLIDVLTQSFTPQQQLHFLEFLTGTPTLPPNGIRGLGRPITVVRRDADHGIDVDSQLPSCNTCFYYLKLPPYTTQEVMQQRLTLAVTEGRRQFAMS